MLARLTSIARVAVGPALRSSVYMPLLIPVARACTTRLASTGATHSFKAETQKLLDIVARSLYSEKEVFIRELISNSSDALEKLRRLQTANTEIVDPKTPLEIRVTVDAKAGTFTIQDTGIGMNEADLKNNLGTIAHSGTSEYMKALDDKSRKEATGLIGQFGVGFYSTFMVGSEVTVYSRPCTNGGSWKWYSKGSESFEISPETEQPRGTKIVIKLKPDEIKLYTDVENVRKIIENHSNFVNFPIYLNGEVVNTLPALWARPVGSITKDEHTRFFQYLTKAPDEPRYHLQYNTDAPLSIKALFYVPTFHVEKYGLARLEPGVSLFSRRVLVQPKCKFLLPDWMRFVRGVVDSEDIPLNLSRELLQNNSTVMRLKGILTNRILKFLSDEAKRDKGAYNAFYEDFGMFLKEGFLTDPTFKNDIAKLLRFSTAKTALGELVSLDDYVKAMPANQKSIYYLMTPTRTLAETSPYYEAYARSGVDVLYLHSAADEFVMHNLREFNGKKVLSVESSAAGGEVAGMIPVTKPQGNLSIELTPDQINELSRWLVTDALAGKVSDVKASQLLTGSPAIIVDHTPASFRAMMKLVDVSAGGNISQKHKLEINTRHPLLVRLHSVHKSHPHMARELAEQLYDNCLMAAGLLEDARAMLARVNRLMLHSADALVKEDSDPKKK